MTPAFVFFSWTLIQSFRIQLKKKKDNIWRIERDGVSAGKFKAARTHFLSDVFVAIAVVVAQTDPIFFQFCAISIHTVRDSF